VRPFTPLRRNSCSSCMTRKERKTIRFASGLTTDAWPNGPVGRSRSDASCRATSPGVPGADGSSRPGTAAGSAPRSPALRPGAAAGCSPRAGGTPAAMPSQPALTPGRHPRSAAGCGGSLARWCRRSSTGSGKPGRAEEGTCRVPEQQQPLCPSPRGGGKVPGARHGAGHGIPPARHGAHPSAAALTSQHRRRFPEQT